MRLSTKEFLGRLETFKESMKVASYLPFKQVSPSANVNRRVTKTSPPARDDAESHKKRSARDVGR